MISRAQALLAEMEAGGHGVIDAGKLAVDLPLFEHDFSADTAMVAQATAQVAAEDALRARLAAANPDLMAPREALDLVYELRELLAGEAKKQ